MKNISILTICLLTLIFGCKKNIDDSTIISDPYVPPIINVNYIPEVEDITSSLIGMVVDELGEPVQDAIVKLGTNSQMTDPFGSFRFENMTMNKKGTFIEIEKQGYFKSGRRFFPSSAETNNIRVELLEIDFSHSIEASSGGTVDFENGGEVNFSPNSIRTQDGSPYTGEVKIARKWLDPSSPATFDQMPGALQGADINGEVMALETYGMIGVELEGANGESLNIMEGHTAEIKMPVPQELLNNAPTEIPLWSFNYDYGIWVEEGKAVLQNGFYVGEVAHFSFWNCDYPRPVVELSYTLIDAETLEPLSGIKSTITINSNSMTGSGISDINGVTSGLVPADEVLELKVLNACNEEIYLQNIGPFSDDTDLGTIPVTINETIILSGTLIDCMGDSLALGNLRVVMNNEIFNLSVNSFPFSFSIPLCSNATEIQVVGGDLSNFEEGIMITVPITDSIDLGTVIACGQPLNNYAVVTIDSLVTFLQTYESGQFDGSGNHQLEFQDNGLTNSSGLQIQWDSPGAIAGDFTNSHNVQVIYIPNNGGVNIYAFNDDYNSFVIEQYPQNIGDVMIGTMEGTQLDIFTGESFYVKIDFRIIRDWN